MNLNFKQDIFKLTNPFLFWFIIIIILFLVIFTNEYFMLTQKTKEVKNNSSMVEQSYQNTTPKDELIIDVDNLHRVNPKLDSSLIEPSYKKLIPNNPTTLLFYLYTIILAFLFIYREKQHRKKLIYLERQEDILQIELAKQSNSINVEREIEKEIEKYKDILNPELDAKTFKNQLEISPEAVIIMSRKITEKILLRIYKKHYNGETHFNNIIITLLNKRIITHNISNLAHTIKAFGNKAVHASLDNPTVFTNKDALLVVGSLLHLVDELQVSNLLEK